MKYIGDVHGKFREYNDIIKTCDKSVQIGDFGLGFKGYEKEDRWWLDCFALKGDEHKFIRGNHDNPDVCRQTKGYIGDVHNEKDTMYISGAWSIDRALRIEGIDWWANEELSYQTLSEAINQFEKCRPKRMVTHDCPASVASYLFPSHGRVFHPSCTSQAFDIMFSLHQPEEWVFGHWHERKNEIINGTRFLCLEELGTINLEDM